MSLDYNTRLSLNIKDKNITFSENFIEKIEIRGVESLLYKGTLSYKPDACYCCGHIFDKNIIKYGFKISTIKLPRVSLFDTLLELKKQRYLCKHCDSTFTLKTSLVKKNCFISNNTKGSVALHLKEKFSQVDIARLNNVSHSTVARVQESFFERYSPSYNYLPPHLCFDEFKSVKEASGAMSFVYCDSESKQIIDIVEDRRLFKLKEYFLRFSKKSRESVKTIVIDMYSPYVSLIKQLFINAQIIIDRFHIVQLFSRALNKTRIKFMQIIKTKFPTDYTKYKKYWRLILKNRHDVDMTKHHYHRTFKKSMTQIEILEYLLGKDKTLKASYEVLQDVLFAVKYRRFDFIDKHLNSPDPNVSEYMKTSLKTVKKYKPHIKNALRYTYSNGVIEGLNNKIKTIKRVSFGYRSFYNFRNRILLAQGLLQYKTTG